MGNQSAPRLEGDRYQHLYSWYEVLQLLDETCPYEYAWIEHPRAWAADDLTLHPKRSTDAPAKFIQIKHHRDMSPYTFDSLCKAERNEHSVLQKLFESWRNLKSDKQVEIWLVSNKPPDLGGFIRKNFCFNESFFKGGPSSRAGKIRECWKNHLGAADGELEDFCRDLRLKLGFVGLEDLEIMVDDRMGRWGLSVGPKHQAAAVHELECISTKIGDEKRITKEVFWNIITKMDLRVRISKTSEPVLTTSCDRQPLQTADQFLDYAICQMKRGRLKEAEPYLHIMLDTALSHRDWRQAGEVTLSFANLNMLGGKLYQALTMVKRASIYAWQAEDDIMLCESMGV